MKGQQPFKISVKAYILVEKRYQGLSKKEINMTNNNYDEIKLRAAAYWQSIPFLLPVYLISLSLRKYLFSLHGSVVTFNKVIKRSTIMISCLWSVTNTVNTQFMTPADVNA